MSEERLPGGFINAVVRVADTVRRPAGPEFVHRLLRHFEAHGWPGAPRYLGLDQQGREMLSFIAGHVAWDGQLRHSDATLVRVAELVREFHDLTAGTALAGSFEVVCHNDLSPKNTVYDAALLPIAFIDWDIAAPGRRIEDVAHVGWQYVGLGPSIEDPADAARQIGIVADAYGGIARDALVETILWWQDRCWRGIAEQADAGEPAMVRLRDLGAVEAVRTAYNWTAAHRETLAAA
jgi:aminoglycoside phosphotransferase (APT) family kinase protein